MLQAFKFFTLHKPQFSRVLRVHCINYIYIFNIYLLLILFFLSYIAVFAVCRSTYIILLQLKYIAVHTVYCSTYMDIAVYLVYCNI